MARKTIFDDLLQLPWWVSVVLAALVYAMLNYIVPSVQFSSPVIATLARSAGAIGTPIIVLLLLVSALSAIKQFMVRRRSRVIHGRQTGIDSVRALSWDDFERLVAHAFRVDGYRVTQNDQKGADKGIDLVLHRDGAKTLVQCKHWKANKIGVSIIRELLGVVHAESADCGIVVGTGKFSKPATEFATQNNIQIIDDTQLIAMLKTQLPEISSECSESSHYAKVTVCPRCGNQMIKRIAKSGPNQGTEFMGCTEFPRCRATVSI